MPLVYLPGLPRRRAIAPVAARGRALGAGRAAPSATTCTTCTRTTRCGRPARASTTCTARLLVGDLGPDLRGLGAAARLGAQRRWCPRRGLRRRSALAGRPRRAPLMLEAHAVRRDAIFRDLFEKLQAHASPRSSRADRRRRMPAGADATSGLPAGDMSSTARPVPAVRWRKAANAVGPVGPGERRHADRGPPAPGAARAAWRAGRPGESPDRLDAPMRRVDRERRTRLSTGS
ncbi:MAG: hypothetical protein MZW92_49000 [Comamonadaceae bacterium]|nr:hypothetical protein [Comamonadaceae bacterium]